MADSSSSSDEEEKAKLESAAWPTFSHGNRSDRIGTKSGNGTEQSKSLRNQEDFEEQGDYRNVDTTPEVKTFIAKKLASWLDSSISVIDGQTGGSTSLAAVDNPDDFQLFSTSKPGLPVKEEPQAVKRKQRPPPSSSDSDSEEERAKLSSVAVSYDQILRSSSTLPRDSQDPQVTSNLSPTNPHSTLTPAESSPSNPSNAPPNSEPEIQDRLTEGDTKMNKKKKRKKNTKTETSCSSETLDELNESGSPKVIENNQSEGKTLGQRPKDFENGKELASEQSERKVKKKKKKKQRRNSDATPQTIHSVNSETSVR